MGRLSWPFPGDAPVTRARKMLGAYRAALIDAEQALADIRAAMLLVDARLIEFDNPAALATIRKTLDQKPVSPELDRRFTGWGELWHCPQPEPDWTDDDRIPTEAAARLAGIAPGTMVRLRVRQRIKGYWDEDIGTRGGWRFRVGDVHQLAADRRWRRKDTTDSITDSRRSDAK